MPKDYEPIHTTERIQNLVVVFLLRFESEPKSSLLFGELSSFENVLYLSHLIVVVLLFQLISASL